MFWNPIQQKNKQLINSFGEGVNTFLDGFAIGEGEITDCLNMTGDDFRSIRTRNDRVNDGRPQLTTPNAIGKRTSTYLVDNPVAGGVSGHSETHVVDDFTWYYSNN